MERAGARCERRPNIFEGSWAPSTRADGERRPGPEGGQLMRWLPEKRKVAAAGPSGTKPPSSTVRRARAPLNAWRLAPIVLWAFVLAGAGGGVLALGRAGGASASATTPGPTETSAGPSGWAQLYVRAFLPAGETNEGQLQAFFPSAPPLLSVHADSLQAAWTVSMGATQVAPGYWTVVVAAEVEAKNGLRWAPLGTRYYAVAVIDQGGGYATTQLPSEVPAPAAAPVPALAVGEPAGVEGPSPITAAVGQFLQALLAGQGNIARYETPGLGVPALAPSPFANVALTGLSDLAAPVAKGLAPTCAVLAQVTGTDGSGRAETLSYALGLVNLDGQWEVNQFGGAPALALPPKR